MEHIYRIYTIIILVISLTLFTCNKAQNNFLSFADDDTIETIILL